MLTMQRTMIKDLAKKYNLKPDFLRTILGRSEFTQFVVGHSAFRDCEELHNCINNVIELKKKSKRCRLK